VLVAELEVDQKHAVLVGRGGDRRVRCWSLVTENELDEKHRR
jgi:hypothetical protein